MSNAFSGTRWFRDPLCLARLLVLGNLVFLMFSPPVTNLAEGLLYLVVLCSATVRQRVLAAMREPLVRMCLLFAVCLIVATFYGPAPRSEAISMLTGWRRLLLLPVAMGVFGESRWKMITLWLFIIVCDIAALVSYGLWVTHINLLNFGPAVSVRNYVTQSMMFSVAAFAAALLLKNPGGWSVARRNFLAGSIVVLVINVVAVMTGRSGYLLLAVCGVTFACSFLPRQRWGIRHLALVLLPVVVVCVAVLAMPGSRSRIEQGVSEAEHYQTSAGLTSIGIRLVFYKNTLHMIAKHPIFGVGTGGFKAAYAREVAGVQGWEATSTTDPHNQFLKIIAEQGLVGFAILLAFIVSAFRQRAQEPFRLLGLGVLCGWCATSMFNSHFSTFAEGRFLFVWLGIMFAALPATLRQPAAG